jgi:hypothetical protein
MLRLKAMMGAMLLMVAGCNPEAATNPGESASQGESKADNGNPVASTADDQAEDALDSSAVIPAGTYNNPSTSFGEMSLLVLKTDGTFHRAVEISCPTSRQCKQTTDGKYQLTKAGESRYIRFYDENGAPVDRWAYEIMADTGYLRLRPLGQAIWPKYPLWPRRPSEDQWCAVDADCELQVPNPFPVIWTCVQESCKHLNYLDDCQRPDMGWGDYGGTCIEAKSGSCAGIIVAAPIFTCGNSDQAVCCFDDIDAVIKFAAQGEPVVAGALKPGAKVRVRYEFARMGSCVFEDREYHGSYGYITMGMKLNNDPSRVSEYSYVVQNGGGNIWAPRPVADIIDLPADARTLTLWFFCANKENLYDSNNGSDYSFAVTP